MSTNFITPIPQELYEIFGVPESGTHIYEKEGNFDEAQAWLWALRSIVGDVVALPTVSLFVPVSRNAIHKRIKQGKLSCFKFQIKDDDPEVSKSLSRERPFAFIPISECRLWLQEYNDRSVMKQGKQPPRIPAETLHMVHAMHQYSYLPEKYYDLWEEPYEKYQEAYLAKTQEEYQVRTEEFHALINKINNQENDISNK